MGDGGISLDALFETIVERVGAIEAVAAIVLGGSRARGIARPDSDVDIGIY
jgi:predicted nucleotidyltransferase